MPFYSTENRTQNNMQRLLCLMGASTEHSKRGINIIRPEISDIMGKFDLESLDPRVATVYNGLVELNSKASYSKRAAYSTEFKDALAWLVWDAEGIDMLKAAAAATNVSISNSQERSLEEAEAEVIWLKRALQEKTEEFKAKVEAEVHRRLAQLVTDDCELLPIDDDAMEPTNPADIYVGAEMIDVAVTDDEFNQEVTAAFVKS